MAEYKFLVGVSLDGPAKLHNTFRKNAAGADSHDLVLNGIECLTRNKAEFNILTLVNSANVQHGREVFRYLRDMGIKYHQYIPCVEFDIDGNPQPWTITGQEWGSFLCDIFDEWIHNSPYNISVRLFDAILTYLVDGNKSICHMDNNCCQYLVVEHNGDIYPCDFFVEPFLKLGNVSSDRWEDIQDSVIYRDFGKKKSIYEVECSECTYIQLCMGDCQKHRINAGADVKQMSWLCEGWKMFYKHSIPGFKRLAQSIINHRNMISSARNTFTSSSAGRNDPCPCGSGKKFKKCHGSSL
jgi:uncharacterized protein